MIFLRNEKKQCARCGWIAKSVTEKNNSRVDCAEAGKKTVQALHFGMLSELTRKGEDFCLPVIAPAQLPVISYQVKADCFLYRNSIIN